MIYPYKFKDHPYTLLKKKSTPLQTSADYSLVEPTKSIPLSSGGQPCTGGRVVDNNKGDCLGICRVIFAPRFFLSLYLHPTIKKI
jgi:hypothetical protein